MKGGVLALASILVAVVGMALVAPVAEVIAADEAKACPGNVCVVLPTSSGYAPEGENIHSCYGGEPQACDDCCNECYSTNYDFVVGNPNCWCTEANRHTPC